MPRIFDQYVAGVQPARDRFASFFDEFEAEVRGALDLTEQFLIYFCATGMRTSEPVEGWISRAGKRCEEIGYAALGQALQRHAVNERGHHLMYLRDTQSLVARRTAAGRSPFDAAAVLGLPLSEGAGTYCRIHEETILGPNPFAQIAIEFEIELLPVNYGERLIRACVATLGREILACLTFVTQHTQIDIGHSKFNALELDRFLAANPQHLTALIAAGSDILDAYRTLMSDCLRSARSPRPALVAA